MRSKKRNIDTGANKAYLQLLDSIEKTINESAPEIKKKSSKINNQNEMFSKKKKSLP
jgi:hypothetical protein